MRTLYLLRHAKAESAKGKEEDIERKLAARGREACAVIGRHMKKNFYAPSLVLCSPAARARETLELVMQAAGIEPPVRFEKRIYLASPNTLFHLLQLVEEEADSLLMVGHNPAMHLLALALTRPENSDSHRQLALKYPTGALTVLKFKVNSWRGIVEEEGELADFVDPDS